eukprot:764428-Hanusia_phi.AAC.1
MYASVRSWVERVRLWVDNVILIDQWTSLEGTENSGTIYMGTAGGYYDVVMEYKQPNGTGGDQGAEFLWQYYTGAKQVVSSEDVFVLPHISGSPFRVSIKDAWTSLSVFSDTVLGGLQLTVYGFNFDFSGASKYICVFVSDLSNGLGSADHNSGSFHPRISNSMAFSSPVVPVSLSKITCFIPEMVSEARASSSSFRLQRKTFYDENGLIVPEFLCSGGSYDSRPCVSPCSRIGCSGCVSGICVRNVLVIYEDVVYVESLNRGNAFFTYESSLLALFPRKSLFLGNAQLLTIVGVGFDSSVSTVCSFSGGNVKGMYGSIQSAFEGTQQYVTSSSSEPDSASILLCTVPSSYQGYGDTSVGTRRASDSLAEQEIYGTSWFTFSGTPTITAISPDFGPISGGIQVTLFGSNLGPAKIMVQARIGGTSALVESRTSYDTVVVRTPQGRGANQIVELITDGQGAAFSYFSYVSAYIIILPIFDRHYNSPGSGSVSLTIAGLNFGTTDPTPSERIDGSACESSQWVSDSTVRCKVSEGIDGTMYLSVTIDLSISWTVSEMLSYDIPSESISLGRNRPGTGSTSISISGSNFGQFSASSSQRIGITAQQTTSWTSQTSIKSLSASGIFSTLAMMLTVGERVGTVTQIVSYDLPTLHGNSAFTTNTASTGSYLLNIIGSNFGQVSYCDVSRMGHTSCEYTKWHSTSEVQCLGNVMIGGSFSVQITVGLKVGTLSVFFSSDTPIVSSILPNNFHASGSASISVFGSFFGLYSNSISGKIGYTAPSATAWLSDTSIAALVSTGLLRTRKASITAGVQVGTSSEIFSYILPVLSSMLRTNFPTTGSLFFTVQGSGFGQYGATVSARMKQSASESSDWISDTCLKGYSSGGFGHSKNIYVTSSQSGTSSFSFSFDEPSLSVGTLQNAPRTGCVSLTFYGSSFAFFDATLQGRSLFTSYENTHWSADTSLRALAPTTFSFTHRIQSTLNLVVGTSTQIVSSDIPALSTLHEGNSGILTTLLLTIIGENFDVFSTTPSPRLDAKPLILWEDRD